MKNKIITAIISAALSILFIPSCSKHSETSDISKNDSINTGLPNTDFVDMDSSSFDVGNSDISDESDSNVEITWDEITEDGVNEELLFENTDMELLTQIASELQALMEEAAEEERENPEIVITEGWARIFEYERYKKVLNMGSPAMKPLYLILYKSPNADEYEYLCARILYELSGFDFYWTNSRDFIDGFNEKILESKQ